MQQVLEEKKNVNILLSSLFFSLISGIFSFQLYSWNRLTHFCLVWILHSTLLVKEQQRCSLNCFRLWLQISPFQNPLIAAAAISSHLCGLLTSEKMLHFSPSRLKICSAFHVYMNAAGWISFLETPCWKEERKAKKSQRRGENNCMKKKKNKGIYSNLGY